MALSTPSDATKLFGRAPHLRQLERLIDTVPSAGAALVLRGEPGIGRTVLLDAARDIALDRRMRVLHTAGVPSECDMPMAGLHRLLRPIASEVSNLHPRHRSVMASAFSLGELHGEALMQVALAALELLAATAAETPVVIVADDLHWLDRESREVVAFVARRVASDPIAVIGAIRDGHEREVGELGIPELKLGRLDIRDAADLLDARAPGLASGVRTLVLAEAAGNPLGVIELPDRETLAALGQGASGALPVTPRLEEAFGGRGRRLPEATATMLLLCAADPTATTSELLAAGERLTGEPMTLADLDPALDARLIADTDNGIQFRHPLMRSATYQAVGLQARHAAHAALVEVLHEQHDRAAWHRAASTLGQDEAVARQMDEWAWRADERGAILQAATSLGRSAELTSDHDLRGNRLIRAAGLAFEAGRAELVATYLDRTSELALNPIARAQAENLRTFSYEGVAGERERIGSLVTLAEHASLGGEPDTALGLLLRASWRSWWADTDTAVRDRLIAVAETTAADPCDARLLATIAIAAPVTQGAVVAERLPHAIESVADAREGHLLGIAAHAITDFSGAQQIFRTVEDRIRLNGQFGLLTYMETIRGWSSLLLGEWRVAELAATEALRLSRQTGQPVVAGFALSTLAGLAGIRGDIERAEELANDAEAILLPGRISGGLAQLQIARGLTDLSAGRHDEAYAQLSRCFDTQDPAHHHSEQFGAVGFFADAAAMTGRQTEARAVIDRLDSAVASAAQDSGIIRGLEHARPLVARDEEAEAAFTHALRAEATSSPFDRARCALFYGMWLRRHRRVVESRGPLRTARDTFARLDGSAWEARALQELRAAGDGDTDVARSQRTWDDLSAQELQIAQMAAAGLSNREIGTRLYLSHRTVGSHLYRIFPKLGITSRSQLNGVLPGRSQAAGS